MCKRGRKREEENRKWNMGKESSSGTNGKACAHTRGFCVYEMNCPRNNNVSIMEKNSKCQEG